MKKLLTLFLLFSAFSAAHAHRLNVLAVYEGGTLNITSYFGDGTYCKSCAYTVTGTDGHVLFKGTLSENGEAVLSGELPSSFFVNVDAGMGHFAKAEVTAEPLTENSETSEKTETLPTVDEDALRSMIRQELGKQTVEIQAAIDKGRTNTDKIIAGIGYLFGIFGLFMLFRKK
ncbi:hypothetical protein EP073_01855 [Geovibrio thiophilus]|uniref:Cobalt ABC transporter permease n=1 Tax=Geovibrio thiophilus TaxID=139438 RepID=A0A3R5Y5H1_9BACT|nr:hypothetical protein [Geovibrio thiophilus]QAR32184.1 hypothetical protein EP073_01855 [Geovibrio thiophilus]